MPRVARALGALEVRRLTAKIGEHAVGGVPGLILQVGAGEASSWILRVTVGRHGHGGQRRAEIGLGPFPAVTLAQARELASQMRQQIQSGVNPVTERRAARSKLVAEQQRMITFEQVATAFIRKKSPEWDNAKHRAQWESTLNNYVYPVIGRMAVADIETAHIVRVLEPIWHEKTETATRVRSRIEAILSSAIALRYRKAPNPAAWRGHLETIFPAPAKIRPERHQPALGIDEAPAFMEALLVMDGMGARALAFTILTAVRSAEAREAVWDEIDLDNAIWTIPAERMKARREHTVPISAQAIELLKKLPRIEKCKFLFPSSKLKPLSDMTLSAVIKRMHSSSIEQGGSGYFDRRQKRVVTVHGFRSTFRDWSAERMSVPNEVCEMALAHGIKDKTEAAYRRGDLFDKRSDLMQRWADFIYN
jgi:integrase